MIHLISHECLIALKGTHFDFYYSYIKKTKTKKQQQNKTQNNNKKQKQNKTKQNKKQKQKQQTNKQFYSMSLTIWQMTFYTAEFINQV